MMLSGTPFFLLFGVFLLLQLNPNGGVNGFALAPLPAQRATALALFRAVSANKRTSASPLAEEALDCFPFLFRSENEVNDTKGRPKLSTTKSKALKVFNEIARIYGDERALNMVKIQPLVLCFDSNNFEPSFNEWAEQFGVDSTKGMVSRNPGLLGVPPVLASEPAEATMALSYLLAVTRPLPKLVVTGAILALLASAVGIDFALPV